MRIHDPLHTRLLARVTQISEECSFRFWHKAPAYNYPVGVASIEVLGIGKCVIDDNERDPANILNQLDVSQI